MAQPAQSDADWKKSLVLPPQDNRKQTEVCLQSFEPVVSNRASVMFEGCLARLASLCRMLQQQKETTLKTTF